MRAGRAPLRRQRNQVVVGPVMVEFRFATKRREARLDRAHVVAQLGRGLVPGRPVSALDVSTYLAAQAETKAAVRVLREFPRNLRADHWAAGKCDRDPGAEGQRRRGGCGDHHPGNLAGLREQYARQPCSLVARARRSTSPHVRELIMTSMCMARSPANPIRR